MRSHRLPAIVVAALLPVTSLAVPVTYEFTGQITGAAGASPPDGQELVPIIPFGTEFTASFTYDDAALAAYDAEGWRIYLDPVITASIRFGSGGALGAYDFAPRLDGESSRISLLNDLSVDGVSLFDEFDIMASLRNRPEDPVYLKRWMSFGTWDPTALQLTGGHSLADPLPVASNPAAFHQFTFGYSLWDESGLPIEQATVTSQEITVRRVMSVPEPGTWSMLITGIAGLWFLGRRRTSSGHRAIPG